MVLNNISHTFTATETSGALVVFGHATAAANGVYLKHSDSDSYYNVLNTNYTVAKVSNLWTLSNAGVLATEASSTTRPQAGVWDNCQVLSAVSRSQTSDVLVVLSIVMSGGTDGGLAAFAWKGMVQPYSLGPETVAVCDTKQVYGPVADSVAAIAGSPGVSVVLSADIIPA